MKITKASIACDLSEASLEEATIQLVGQESSGLYRLQIGLENLPHAIKIIKRNVLNIHINIELCPALKDGWALWSNEACYWSPGA